MPESERKEPGRTDVQHRERGDLRQHQNPIDKQKDTGNRGPAQDSPPAGSRHDPESPWMGGG